MIKEVGGVHDKNFWRIVERRSKKILGRMQNGGTLFILIIK
jgi:hypothetical protein